MRNANMQNRVQLISRFATALCVTLAACDTTVTNPGPVQDDFLAAQTAQAALVNGAGRAVASGLNWIGYTGAAVTREIHPAGSTGSFGITGLWQIGDLNSDLDDVNDHWNNAQRARWISEETIRRMDEVGAFSNALKQQAYLWAGFANRVLGENMCEAVIDGGAIQPNAQYFLRAEDNFTKAIAVQTGNLATAAYAGRAAARVFLNKWAEAVSDAANVPTTFVYNISYFNLGEDATRNRIFYATGNTPYRAHTQWNTWIAEYRNTSNDARVPFRVSGRDSTGDAAIECCGRVAWWPQTKHNSSAAPVRLASGREMRLIEAEARLRSNDVPGAVAKINEARANVPVANITATTSAEAWTLLKRERGIELWLEARRLGDLRRWKEGGTPGTLHVLEGVGTAAHLTKQDLCFPISRSERDTNANLR
ncbi:MAG: RagB/SusD family nutrient uptake outer membrane protein [Longimicrobiales bacterium]